MKHLFRRAGRFASSGAFLFVGTFFVSLLVAPSQVAQAQTTIAAAPTSATLQSDRRVLDTSGNFVLSLTDSPFNSARFRIGLFRAGQTAKLAEERRDFTVQNGALSTQIHLEAPPGDYELRVLSDDQNRAPLSSPALVTVPGIRREPGWWLFNGQPFVTASDANTNISAPNAPLFIAGLKRDFGKKPKPISRNLAANTLLQYRVLELPPLSEISAPNYDSTALRLKVIGQINDARNSGQRNLTGFELPLGVTNPNLVNSDAKIVVGRLRQILNEVAPDAALIISTDSSEALFRLRNLETYVPLCDAAVLITNSEDAHDLWAIKALRRVAEEQPNYDLPIFVRTLQSKETGYAYNALSDSHALDLWMSGATGFIEYSNDAPIAWKAIAQRNAALFVGSVTLEDIGVLAIPEWNRETNVSDGDMFKGNAVLLYRTLRDAGRIPQTSRLPDLTQKESERKTESLMVALGQRVSNETIERLRAAAKAGNRVYIEGAPMQDENSKETGWRLGSLVGGDIAKGDVSASNSLSSMTLQDGWMFGTERGTKIPVSAAFRVMLNNGSVAPRTKDQKGLDILLKPRVAAVLDDGSPALIINPVGKGEVIWMPFALQGNAAQRREWYQAVSNYIEPSLVTLRAKDASSSASTNAANVHLALRRSTGGTLLLGLFNDSAETVNLSATVETFAGVALDLRSERELPLTTRGNESTVNVSISANSWSAIAFAVDRKTLDTERDTFTGKVRLK